MTAATQGSIWAFHEKVVGARELAIKYCGRLRESDVKLSEVERFRDRPIDPEFDDRNDRERLRDACPSDPGEYESDIWCLLGAASGNRGNPLTVSLHAQTIGWCRSLLSALLDPGLLFGQVGDNSFTDDQHDSLDRIAREELAEIAGGHCKQLEAITRVKLGAEAQAACRLCEEQRRSDHSGGGNEQPLAATKPTGKAATCHQLMMDMITKNQAESVAMTAHQWSLRLDKSASTVKGTEAWKLIQGMRAHETLSRARPTDRRHRTKRHFDE
jgi:hypothetical protein